MASRRLEPRFLNLCPPESVPLPMRSLLREYCADHRFLLSAVRRQTGMTEPVVLDLDEFAGPLLKAARKREFLPIDGVLVRDWDPSNRRTDPGVRLGMRLYDIEGVRLI